MNARAVTMAVPTGSRIARDVPRPDFHGCRRCATGLWPLSGRKTSVLSHARCGPELAPPAPNMQLERDTPSVDRSTQ